MIKTENTRLLILNWTISSHTNCYPRSGSHYEKVRNRPCKFALYFKLKPGKTSPTRQSFLNIDKTLDLCHIHIHTSTDLNKYLPQAARRQKTEVLPSAEDSYNKRTHLVAHLSIRLDTSRCINSCPIPDTKRALLYSETDSQSADSRRLVHQFTPL